jgi:hypothetical protein
MAHNESLTAATINRDVKINYIIFQTQYSLFLYRYALGSGREKCRWRWSECFLLWCNAKHNYIRPRAPQHGGAAVQGAALGGNYLSSNKFIIIITLGQHKT